MERDYQAILQQMTLEEKASLCSGLTFWKTKPIERLDVPSVWMSDGPHGLRKEKPTKGGGTNIMQPAEPATCFPPAVTTASSWDVDLVEEVGSAIAEEAKALKVSTVLGPGVNIKRSPLCGRNFEYFSEDPFLSGRMGASYVHGVQKNGIGVSLKHFCANNQEHIRMGVDTIVDERTLREIYLPAFEHVVKTEQPTTVMSSYNLLGGKHLTDHKRMLDDVLRKEWGFEGIVISDWGAMFDRVESIKAGNDLEMPANGGMNDRVIVKAVKEGRLDEADLDKVVLRLLKFAFECKESEVDDAPQNLDAHHELARRAAESGAVLLRNENNALPLKKEQNIAVIGALAKKLRYQGAGSSHINPPKTVSFLQALDNAGQAYEFAEGYSLKGDGYKKGLIKKALKVAEGKDAVVVCVGLTDAFESEGYDRTHINMPEAHNYLLEELAKVNNNIIVVTSCGSPIQMTRWIDKVNAVLNVYLGGQAGGEATYNLLYGNVNPSGKLAETFPYRTNDSIVANYFPMGPRQVEYREGIYVGYRYYDKAEMDVQFPFGYGLSYTTFEYSDLKLSAKEINENDGLTVSLKVKNTGDRAGAEVVQLYVEDVESTIFRPVKELKGFTKVFLEAGEEKEIEITLDSRAFAYYNVSINDWHVESGEFKILVGASSRDIRLEDTVNVTSANPDALIPDYSTVAPYYFNLADNKNATEIPTEQFEALYGEEIPENRPYVKGEFTIDSSVQDIKPSLVGNFIYTVLVAGVNIVAPTTENPEMLKHSIKDMPIRSFGGFTGGILSQMTMDGIVDMCNGTKGGFAKILKGFSKKNR